MKMKFILVCVISVNLFAQDNHEEYTEILQKYVSDGFVNYKGMLKDKTLDNYLEELGNTDPDTINNEADQIAFYLNAYNAYTLKIILDNYPVESINDLHSGGLIIGTVLGTTIWDEDFVIINNRRTTLDHIEHEILREKYDEPRIHFALVCASISCPPLRSEAYEGYKLNHQLEDQGRIFLRNTTKNEFNFDEREAEISKIFDWFEEDFGEDDEEVLRYISGFLKENEREAILENLTEWVIDYKDYNWNLNEETK